MSAPTPGIHSNTTPILQPYANTDKSSNTFEFYVTVQLYADSKPLTQRMSTSYKAFKHQIQYVVSVMETFDSALTDALSQVE